MAAHAIHPRVFPGEALHFEYSTSKGVPARLSREGREGQDPFLSKPLSSPRARAQSRAAVHAHVGRVGLGARI